MSAIVIQDYDTVSRLADAIKTLNSDDKLYSSYVSYKTAGVTNPRLLERMKQRPWGIVHPQPSFFDGYVCHVCQRLHGLIPSPSRTGEELSLNCPVPNEFDTNTESIQDRIVSKYSMWNRVYHSEILRAEVTVKLVLQNASEVSKQFLDSSVKEYLKKSMITKYMNLQSQHW